MTTIWNGSLDLYGQIAKPLRDDDAMSLRDDGKPRLLQRFLIGGQAQHQLIEGEIISLLDQISPYRIRASLLTYLKDIVGLGPDLDDITSGLTATQLRKLIVMAPSLLKQLGTVPGMLACLRTILSRPATYLDWFKYRFICGEACLEMDNSEDAPLTCIVGGVYDENVRGDCTYLLTKIHPVDRYDSKWSLVKVMDDGVLSSDMLLKLLSLNRAIGERIEVQLLEFIDEMSLPGDSTDMWDVTGAGSVSIADKVMTITPGTTLVPRIVCADPSEMSSIVMSIDFKFEGDQASLVFEWYKPESGNTGTASLVLSATSVKLTLRHHNGSTWVTDAQDEIPRIGFESGAWYNLKVESFVIDSTHTGIRVYLDGNMVLPTSGDRMSVTDLNQQGTTALSFSGFDSTKIRMAEIRKSPMRYALIDLSNGANPRGVIEKSSNF